MQSNGPQGARHPFQSDETMALYFLFIVTYRNHKVLNFIFVLIEPFSGHIIFDESQTQIGAAGQNAVLNSITSLRG